MQMTVMNRTLEEWFDLVPLTQSELKIFHPDFSLVSLSGLAALLGVGLSFTLLALRWLPLTALYRHRQFTSPCFNIHAYLSIAIWLSMLIEVRPHDRGTVLAMGLNVFFFVGNSALMRSCDSLAKKRLDEQTYRRALDDAVVLYEVSEAQCREVVSDGRMILAFLRIVNDELNMKNYQDSNMRREKGKLCFDELLARERLHRTLIETPHRRNTLSNWRKYGTFTLEEEEDDENMENID